MNGGGRDSGQRGLLEGVGLKLSRPVGCGTRRPRDDGADRRRRGANGRAQRTRRHSRASWMRARLWATVRARSLTHSAALGRDRARRQAKCGGATMAKAKGHQITTVTHGATFVVIKNNKLFYPILDYESEIPANIEKEYNDISFVLNCDILAQNSCR